MRTFEEIETIICNLEENLFERLNDNDFDAFMGDKNAQARFRRALKKLDSLRKNGNSGHGQIKNAGGA